MFKSSILTVLLISATAGSALAGGPTATDKNAVKEPAGWFLAGDSPEAYATTRDTATKHSGKSAARLASISDPKDGFGTLMQTIAATPYRGKRVRLSAWVKTDKLADWAGLWMRVDDANNNTRAFDNMQDRRITGTSEWARHEVVLDVAKDAASISFGTLLVDQGTLWIDDVSIEVVPSTVAVTAPKRTPAPAPRNLAFEE